MTDPRETAVREQITKRRSTNKRRTFTEEQKQALLAEYAQRQEKRLPSKPFLKKHKLTTGLLANWKKRYRQSPPPEPAIVESARRRQAPPSASGLQLGKSLRHLMERNNTLKTALADISTLIAQHQRTS